MKILLDECLPRPLKFEFVGYEIHTVVEMGWSGKKNGDLLRHAINSKFDISLTADQNIEYQLNLKTYEIGIIIMAARTNEFEALKELIPNILEKLPSVTKDDVIKFES